ncbi:hypothetical protein Scep_003404 [Stephania cephalantha]|uniref:Uncharacterized protein n=1 Tax=Stephania cephalantha TaxID=152367 RepID=A0AAP0KRD2_9MAGN
MGSLSRTGICLIAVLAIALSGLLAQFLYVLWCRRRFRLQNQTQNLNSDRIAPHHHDHHHHHTAAALSKDLLYFFLCWHHHSRIGPTAAAAAAGAPPFSAAGPSLDSGDLAKWHGLYGPSRALFTIDEDEREDPGGPEVKKMKRVSLEDRFTAAEDGGAPPVSPAVEVDETPFSTPCESPVFYTPSPSPPREAARLPGNDVMVDLEVGEL